MKKSVLITAAMLVYASIFAQPQPVGHLTVFSEDGDKFFLILNGERQNNVAQTNLRIEDLPQPYYNVKVIFEDKSFADITKNMVMIADADGRMMDVTYKVKRDKNGTPKMSSLPFSFVPVRQGFVPPSNVYVMHYGAPAPVANTVITTTPVATQTTTTTTTTTGTVGTVGASVNVGGIGMNVTITDPLMDGTVQTTTTTSRTTTVNSTAVAEPPRQVGCVNAIPMSSADFSSALGTIKNQSFSDSQLKTAKQVASGNCLTAGQISQICQIFSFEESKLDFAKYAYDFCTEPRNYFKVNNVFSFSSSSDELNDYVQSRQ